jgi:branched-chain amino acid transport system permease protein
VTGVRELLGHDRLARGVAAAIVAYSLLYWLPASPLPRWMPWGVVFQGVIFGTSYALLAMGLILIYRTTRIVNFAYGAMGAMPGSLAVALFVAQGWNYGLAVLTGVLVGVGTGAAIEVLVIRRFARSSRLVLTVASIGLAQLLGAIGIAIGVALGTDALIGNIDTPLSASWFVRPYPVRGDHLLMIGVAPLVLAGLGWFLLRTDAGRAVRAAAENEDRALLLGVPVRRLQTIVWAVAGGVSTITFITRAPFTGVVPEGLVGTTAILPGLAVAVIARFKSLPAALVAGLGLGIAEWTIRWNVSAESVFDVAFLVAILVALLLQRHSVTRAETGESSWDSAGVLKPIPYELRSVPEVRLTKRILTGAGLGFLLLWPLTLAPSTMVTLSFGVIWALVAVSLAVLTGWGGNISLGQFAIVAVGAMTAGNALVRWNMDLFAALALAVVAGGIASAVLGVPALRIRGLYLAVTTLAFAVALDSYFLNPINFPAVVPDRIVRPVVWKRFDLASEWAVYYLCLAGLLGGVAVVRSLRRHRGGRAVIAVRDNERAAEALAVPSTRVKLQSFVLAGCLAGLAGGLYIVVAGGAGQGTFKPNMSVEVFSFAVIGGLGSVAGVVSGVALFRLVDFVLAKGVDGEAAEILRLSLTGGGLLLVLYFLPAGLWQYVQRIRDRMLRHVAERRGLHVPSLVADRRVDDEPEDETAVISGAMS